MIRLTFNFLVLSVLFFACKKEISPVQPHTIEAKAIPVTGLVITTTSATMSQMTYDADSKTNTINENLDILARAFQSIACDTGFAAAIGASVDEELEFSLAYFFMNYPNYETAIQNWLTLNNYTFTDVMLSSISETPWIYAANYGVHNDGVPTLALAIDLDSTILGEKSDFIPCYYSEESCNEYLVGLIGLESDLGPEDPALPTRELVLIFSAQNEDSFNKKEVLEYGSTNQYLGTIIDPGTASSGCEYAEAYVGIKAYLSESFQKSKKVKLSTRFKFDADCDGGWGLGGDDHGAPKKITEGDKSTMLNNVLTFTYNLEYNANIGDQLAGKHAVGAVYERDWYAKSPIQLYVEPGWCAIGYFVEFSIKAKNSDDVYALYYIKSPWCLNEIREFRVPANQPGDHDSYFQVKASVY